MTRPSAAPGARITVTPLDEAGAPLAPADSVAVDRFAAFVRGRPADQRWVWSDTTRWYPALLAAGVRVERCHDLRLCHTILRDSELCAQDGPELGATRLWATSWRDDSERPVAATLFDLDEPGSLDGAEAREQDAAAEVRRQLAAVAASSDPGRLRLLLAAESAGALVAAELRHVGLPWRVERHDELLRSVLGPRPTGGARPAKLEGLVTQLRRELSAPTLNPDSPGELLRALRGAGVSAGSTRSWELKKLTHPAIGPLLDYKKRARLHSANGWAWQDEWVHEGRFHAEYVPGGVVTGRWAAHGGGALQLPKEVRRAVVADDGWKLVVADAAQLEPRILAAVSGDAAMAAAGTGQDLYNGIVAAGVVADRAHAKVAMLGAMYGATTGDSARLIPSLTRAYPRAMRLVERAARTGEAGGVVSTWLGRSSPKPGARWRAAQSAASAPDASDADERRARSTAREWGRFTRNFIVQGTAAEWALCWMAGLRSELAALEAGRRLEESPQLVYFLHDEVIVHTPAAHADRVAELVREAATQAGRLLFGRLPVSFPVTVDVVDCYAEAK